MFIAPKPWRVKKGPAARAAAIRTIRTIVVDDKPAVVDGIRRFFALQGGVTVVAVAMNGREAIDKVAQNQPDLVVMDLHMPEMNGFEVAADMHRRFPNVRIIMISVEQGAHIQGECLRHGADRFLPKIGLHRTLMPEIRHLFPDYFFSEGSAGASAHQ